MTDTDAPAPAPASREFAYAQARLSPAASARIHAALADRAAHRMPRPNPGLVVAAALVLAGLMPWSTAQCQAARAHPTDVAGLPSQR